MKIRQDQLGQSLQRGLAACYLVSGDEPLLVMEACDEIRAAARVSGIDERQLFHAEAGFDWGTLREEASAMSLFASRRLLEVRIPNGKPSDKGETFKALMANPSPDNVLLIICPRLDSKTQNTAWYKAIDKAGVVLPIWPVERNQYQGWLARRMQMAGLHASPDALALLAHQTEGNLLAAVQEIEKLRMSGAGQAEITRDDIEEATGDNARFDAFTLADACLAGKTAEASRILAHLKSEGNEPLMILGALTRKIRQLIALQDAPPEKLGDVFRKQFIWPKQQGLYRSAMKRLGRDQLTQSLLQAEQVDHAAKGEGPDPWLLLASLILCLTGQNSLSGQL